MQKLILKNRKGQNIVGILESPKGEAVGTCIIQHGYSGYKEQDHIQTVKDCFLENGFITFIFDTTNSFGESDGDFEKATLGLHYEDLEDVVNWSQQQNWFAEPLALAGHSMGGYAVIRYTQEYPDKVGFLVSLAPVISGEVHHATYQKYNSEIYQSWKEKGIWEVESKSRGVIKKQPWNVMVEMLNHNLFPKIKNITIPTFLYIGENDTLVLPENTEKLYGELLPNKTTYIVAPNAKHTYRTPEELEHLHKELSYWIYKQIT